jgi:hypothetical protein
MNNKSENSTKNNKIAIKRPIYLYSPEKTYENAEQFKLDISRDYKQKTIIYQ